MTFLIGVAVLLGFCILVLWLLVSELRRQGGGGDLPAFAAAHGLELGAGAAPVAWTLRAPGEPWQITAYQRVGLGDSNTQLTRLSAPWGGEHTVLVGRIVPAALAGAPLDDPRLQAVLTGLTAPDRAPLLARAQPVSAASVGLPAAVDAWAGSEAELGEVVTADVVPALRVLLAGARAPALIVGGGTLDLSVRGIESDPVRLEALVAVGRSVVAASP